jgi:hypothetical protein
MWGSLPTAERSQTPQIAPSAGRGHQAVTRDLRCRATTCQGHGQLEVGKQVADDLLDAALARDRQP